MIKKITILLALLALFASAGCESKNNQQVNTNVFQPEIEAADQKITDKIIVDKASIPVNGWIVVYEAKPIPEEKQVKMGPKYERGKMLGYKFLPQGKNENIEVQINKTQAKKLMLMVQVDKGQKGILDDISIDAPYYYNMGPLMIVIGDGGSL